LNEIRHVQRGGAGTKIMKDDIRKVDKTQLERFMKNLTTRLRLLSLPPLILLDGESTQTSFMQLSLASIHSSYTSADITRATLKLSANTATGGVTSAVFEPKPNSGLLAPTGLSRQA
jgi:hypothetical protein